MAEAEAKKIKQTVLAIDPFKLMEMMGWGWGILKQAVFTLPANTTISATLEVPSGEVWWITFGMFGGFPSDSIIYTYESEKEIQDPTLLHGGWLENTLCPPGYRRVDEFVTGTFQNVTGNPAYNTLPAQDLPVRVTLFIFRSWRRYTTKIEEALEQLTGMEVLRK